MPDEPQRDKHPSGVHDFGEELKRSQPIADRDRLFAYFARGLIFVLLLYGGGMTLVILLGKDQIAVKMLNVFSTMFAAVVGLGSGYLLGRRDGNGKAS